MSFKATLADLEVEGDRLLVAAVAREIIADHGHAPVQGAPLQALAEGRCPENTTVFVVRSGKGILGMAAGSYGKLADEYRCFGFATDRAMPFSATQQVVTELLSAHMWWAMRLLRTHLTIDGTQSLRATIEVARHLNVAPSGKDNLYELSFSLKEWATSAPAFGAGAWCVVVHNNDTTEMQVVIEALSRVLKLPAQICWHQMIAVHTGGSAVVRRHYFRRNAERTRKALSAHFDTAGSPTLVTTEHRP